MQIPGLNGRVEARTVGERWLVEGLLDQLEARTAFGGNQQRYLNARLWDTNQTKRLSDLGTLRRTSVREERGVGDVT